MSLLFENIYIPREYDLSLKVSDSKPNYSGIVKIQLVKNEKNNEEENGNACFKIALNTAEIISMSCNLFINETAYKLNQKLDKLNEITEYFSNDLTFAQLRDCQDEDIFIEIKFLSVVRKILTYEDETKGVFSTKFMDPITGKADKFLLSTHSQPYFARYIFPCLDDLNLKCQIKLSLETKNEFTCISNLPLESSTFVSETSNKLVTFEKSPPMTVSLFSFAIGHFDYIENIVELPVSKKSLPLRIYTMLGESERAQFSLDILSQTVTKLEEKFKVHYPLPKLDLVALPFLSDGGVENWSMLQIINEHILLPDYKISDTELTRKKNLITDVIVHEIIHMYVGNLITFESYDHTWLNEAFATFMSNTIINELFDSKKWFNLLNKDLENLKLTNSSLSSKAIVSNNAKPKNIGETFSRNSYEKGIFLVRMLASLFNDSMIQLNSENYDLFFEAVGEFIKLNEFENFKPVDLWNFLKSHKLNKFSYDIPTIMNSWIRTPGLPIIKIEEYDEKSLKLVQRRYLVDVNEQNQDFEDVPFHIPLLMKTNKNELARQLMTDRSLTINLETENIDWLYLNANNSVICSIIYNESYSISLIKNFASINSKEQLEFFKNFSSILGNESHQNNEAVSTFFKIFKHIKNIKKMDHFVMNYAITILTNLYNSILTISYFEDKKIFNALNKYVDDLLNRFLPQFEWDNFQNNPLDEIHLRSSLLSLKLDNTLTQNIGKKLFKKILHGPKQSVNVELCLPVLKIISQFSSMKEFKEISKLIKSPGLILNNFSNCKNPVDIQTSALHSLGYFKDEELFHKVLNYVKTNNDIRLIELALLGLRYQMNYYQDLWKWYVSNYPVWYSRYLRDEKSYQGLFFKHVSELCLECCLIDPKSRADVEKFVEEKNTDVLKEWFAEAREKHNDLLTLNKANHEVVSIL